jgi:hypothetical protein
MLDQHFAQWFKGKSFTTDFASAHLQTWADIFEPIREQPLSILEIGSWEGRSAIFFLEFFVRSRLTCVDTFEGGDSERVRDPVYSQSLSDLERRFDLNLSDYGSRYEKMKMRSLPALDKLVESGRLFDLIYIDGSHQRDDVLMDSIISWRVLAHGGHIIWDDYLYDMDRPSQAPKQAIDTFLSLNRGDFTLVHKGSQIIIRRLPSSELWDGALTLRLARTPRNFIKFLRGHPIRFTPHLEGQ